MNERCTRELNMKESHLNVQYFAMNRKLNLDFTRVLNKIYFYKLVCRHLHNSCLFMIGSL